MAHRVSVEFRLKQPSSAKSKEGGYRGGQLRGGEQGKPGDQGQLVTKAGVRAFSTRQSLL